MQDRVEGFRVGARVRGGDSEVLAVGGGAGSRIGSANESNWTP